MESMEGRLMLATTVTEFLPSGLTAAQYFTDSDAPAFTANRSTFDFSLHEGGFISAPLKPVTNPLDLDAVGDFSPPQLAPSNPSFQDSADLPASVANPVNISGGDTTLSTEDNSNSGGLHFGNSGIQPAIISSYESTRGAAAFIGPVLSASHFVEPLRDEGGPISIAAVLTNIRPLETLESHEPAPTQLAASVDDEAPTTSSLTDLQGPADREISGELARALVFEIAGGEPTASARIPHADRTDASADPPDGISQQIYRPVSIQDQPSQAQGSMPERVGRTVQVRSTIAQHGAGSVFRTAVQNFRGGDDQATISPTLVPLSERKIASAGAAVAAIAAPRDPARAQVFEGLGQQSDVPAEPLAIQISWRGALNATPLLMILALERIAASNSRRASRHEEFVSTHKSCGRSRAFEQLRK
jgi:hypothetical protein